MWSLASTSLNSLDAPFRCVALGILACEARLERFLSGLRCAAVVVLLLHDARHLRRVVATGFKAKRKACQTGGRTPSRDQKPQKLAPVVVNYRSGCALMKNIAKT